MNLELKLKYKYFFVKNVTQKVTYLLKSNLKKLKLVDFKNSILNFSTSRVLSESKSKSF